MFHRRLVFLAGAFGLLMTLLGTQMIRLSVVEGSRHRAVAESKLDRAGAFTYSVEPGTTSALLPHRVDPAVAALRQQKLMEIQRAISRARHEAMVGRELDVLVEGVSPESEYLLEGRWYGQAPGIDGVTYLADGQVPAGSLVRARITQASDYDLAATLEL